MRLNSGYLWFNQLAPKLWSQPGIMFPEELSLDMLGHGSSQGQGFQAEIKERLADILADI